ncbi:MAG: HEPN domain-containing protein [Candidatus Helarchaeota archaeon]|nr:HEPN domain-containing protein [Candidatus Helarchaeota archaeon]
MNQERKTIIKYRLERAEETIKDAESLLNEGSLFSAVNRIYYAMFYSINALLLLKGLSSSKHSGVRNLFNKEFVNTGIVNKEFGRFYNTIFEYRQKGDYEDFVEFNKEDVRKWLKKANNFIRENNLIIEKELKT